MYIIYVCVIYVIYIKQRKPSQQGSRKWVYRCAQEGLREKMELKIKFKFKSSYELFGKKKWSQTWSHGTSVPFGYKFPSSCLTYFKQKCSGSNLSTLAQTTSLLSSLQYWTHSLFFSLTLLLRNKHLSISPSSPLSRCLLYLKLWLPSSHEQIFGSLCILSFFCFCLCWYIFTIQGCWKICNLLQLLQECHIL